MNEPLEILLEPWAECGFLGQEWVEGTVDVIRIEARYVPVQPLGRVVNHHRPHEAGHQPYLMSLIRNGS